MTRLVRTSSFSRFISLLLSYLLAISLYAPFTLRRTVAATSSKTNTSTNATPPASSASKHKGKYKDGELIVRFKQNLSEQEKKQLVESQGAQLSKKLKGKSRIEKITLSQGQDVDAIASQLRKSPAVEFVEPNFLVARDQVSPGDPRFAEQWALKNTGQSGGQPNSDIGAVSAWETTTGSQTTIIAVIDSGIDFTHPDLQHNQWTNSNEQPNGRDDDNDSLTDDLHGWDWVGGDNDPRDMQGHGTAVAGIIAAEGNNSVGITGVMWKASLMNLRVLDNTGNGEIADAVEAIDYAVDHGASVINCSWGTDDESLALKDAIERAGTSGVVVVSSAGNSGRDIETEPYYPSSFGLSNQIVVASTDNFDHLSSWSNYGGTHVTVAAPGTNILTTTFNGGYTTVTGTSASTPFVTGVVGLLKTQRWWLSAAGTKAAIVDGARHLDELSGKVSASGVVSASGAINSLQGPNTPPPGGGNGNGNSGGGNGNGNGNGNNGGNGHPRIIPPTPGQGKAGSNQPSPITSSVPGSPLPDLNKVRKMQPTEPKAPKSIHADLCPDCDPGGGTPPSGGGSDPYFATARVRPQNEVGEHGIDLGSRNFNWGLPLVSLPGRAGMDLNLGLVYNSLVWTRQGNSIMYNADHGFPSPGFQLGVPRLEMQYINQDEVVTAYLLDMPSGQRIQLPQVGTSNIYESQDSSYIQLVDHNLFYGGWAAVLDKSGTQYVFSYPPNVSSPRCTQVKDRNGNYITINYNANGQISNLVDTLGRTVTFNYVNDYLDSITQTWNGQTHVWATFGYGSVYFSTNFPGLSYLGPQGYINVLTQVGLADGTRYNFSYTSFGQVYKISHYAADNHLLSYTGYNLSGSEWQPSITAQTDCPRFTEQHDWAENWNNNQEAITYYSVDPNSAGGNQPAWSQVVTPDGTTYIETYSTASDWTKGLTTGTEVWVGGVKRRWTTTAWTQDDTTLAFQKNPRPYDMSTYDEAGNRRHTDIIYTSYGLPGEVREYSPDGSGFGGFLRRTYTDYRLDQAYIDRHIIGLVSAIHVVDENNNYVRKVTFDYDRGGECLTGTPQATIQHDDTYYGAGLVYGRGNQTDVWLWDVTDINNAAKAIGQSHSGYDTNGSVVFTRDALNHQTTVSYADSFADNINRNTFAYPTTVTDPDSYSSTSKYDYSFGAVTRTQDPKGAAVQMDYDGAGRISQATNLVNNAHKRWVYHDYGDVATYTNVNNLGTNTPTDSSFEAFAVTYFDGAGRVRATGGDLPNSSGGYFGSFTLYDIMGRPAHQSNTEEMNNYWAPAGEDAVGWIWTDETYDWKGRPLVTTFTDGHIRSVSYNACGCAGSEVTTVTDERGRARRLTKDSLGRLKTVEELNWDGTVYSNANYTYDALDHLKTANQLGVLWRTFNYDGYGRPYRRTTPEQGQTNYSYFADGSVQTVTDARQATATYAYNNRHQPTSITYYSPNGVSATANVSFAYDEAGNLTSMSDGLGSATYHYNQLSQMDWEERSFTGVGTYRLSYDLYNYAGELKSLTGPSQFGSVQVSYSYDPIGRVNGVGGANYAGVSSYVNSIGYRAFGGIKTINYGNSKQLSVGYDYRLRMTSWNVSGVLGYNYAYNYFNENSDRVTYAQSTIDSRLDRSYDYDQVGRMWASHTGREARWHTGQEAYSGADGPYAENYAFDQAGDIIGRNGWGATNSQYNYNPQFWDNKMAYNPITGAAVQYDLAGNLINDGQQTYSYDATGQQTYASLTNLTQSYDGNGVRVKKTENAVTTYYLRSSVLGGKVICELDGTGGWARGYVYLGGQMLAIQHDGVYWIHQDPVTKSQRMTANTGALVTDVAIELDPWGGDTGWNQNPQTQPHRYTTYERDANGSDEAMMRRYEGKWGVFAQPDPYNGSYDLTNPQSLHRYAYSQNDPVNSIDPSGLMPCEPGNYSAECGSSGFGGWGGGFDLNDRSRGGGRDIISERGSDVRYIVYTWWDDGDGVLRYHNLTPFYHADFYQQTPVIPITTRYMAASYRTDFNQALAEAEHRIFSKKSCADLFGGVGAIVALESTEYRVLPLGAPSLNQQTGQYGVTGAQTNSSTSVFINSQGPFFNTIINIPGVGNRTFDFGTGLSGAEFGALLLLHELGHQIGIFRSDRNDSALNRSYTQQVQDACF
jgi:RHS repeat-associated protein